MILGVLGAGTMGRGIAELGVGAPGVERVLVHDPAGGTLAEGARRVEAVAGLAPCDVVVEAVPEDLGLKRSLLAQVAEHVRPDAVLATNTSSLLVAAVARDVPGAERVVGLHFFNPAPRMRAVELVAGPGSSAEALGKARALAEAMGRTVVEAADGPGFLVNRCNRPFGLEAARLLEQGVADAEAIDRCVRVGGGFRMGPFELADLVGLDTGLAVSESFFAASFGEPRWRPSPRTAQLVAAGRLGRKSGEGWHRYPRERPRDPAAGAPGGGDGRLVVVAADEDDLAVWDHLVGRALEAGFDVRGVDEAAGEVPWLILDGGAELAQGGPRAVLCAEGRLADLDPDGSGVGFHALPPLQAVELTRQASTSRAAAGRVEAFFACLGLPATWVGDAPGLVLGRIVCQLVNEAAFAVEAGVGTPEAIDAGMELGLNHPRGPFAWLDAVGGEHVRAVLGALRAERGDAYVACPSLPG